MHMHHHQHKILPSPRQLGLVAACFRGGQRKDGVQWGPRAILRGGGFLDRLSSGGVDVVGVQGDTLESCYDQEWNASVLGVEEERDDDDDNESRSGGSGGMVNARLVSAATRRIAEKTYQHARAGRLVVTLGGDHSVGIGSVAGVAKAMRERNSGNGRDRDKGRRLAVVWVDAHADINTPATSPSGNLHGMPLAFLTGLAVTMSAPSNSDNNDNDKTGNDKRSSDGGQQEEVKKKQQSVFDWLTDDHRIGFEDLVYIGIRDLDESEKKTIRDKNIKAFSIHDVEEQGVKKIVDLALAHIGPDAPIHFVFDIDGLDPYWAPSTGLPVEQGLSLREACVIAERLHDSGQVVAIDLVEVNPLVCPEGVDRTVRSGIKVVMSALGQRLTYTAATTTT